MTDVTAAWTIATLFACAGMVAAPRAATLDRVEKKSRTLRDFRLESRYGPMASRVDAAKWAPALKPFMDRLTAARS